MKILCISDSHLYLNTYEREEKLLNLLRNEDFDELILLGDIYDFWFEYKGFIPSYSIRFTSEVVNLSSKKIIHYVSGNHDAWIGDFWKGLGVNVYRYGFYKEIGGKKVFFTHGDYLLGNRSSKLIRKIFHNPLAMFLFKLIPVEVALALSGFLSYESRKRNEEPNLKKIEDIMAREDADIIITGHLHIPLIKAFNGRVFICVGDWMEHFTYLLIRDGEFILKNNKGVILSRLKI